MIPKEALNLLAELDIEYPNLYGIPKDEPRLLRVRALIAGSEAPADRSKKRGRPKRRTYKYKIIDDDGKTYYFYNRAGMYGVIDGPEKLIASLKKGTRSVYGRYWITQGSWTRQEASKNNAYRQKASSKKTKTRRRQKNGNY